MFLFSCTLALARQRVLIFLVRWRWRGEETQALLRFALYFGTGEAASFLFFLYFVREASDELPVFPAICLGGGGWGPLHLGVGEAARFRCPCTLALARQRHFVYPVLWRWRGNLSYPNSWALAMQ